MNSKKILFFLFAIFPVFSLFTSCKVNQQNVVTISPSLLETGIPKKVTVTDITEEDIRNHISVLASDSMQGRKINTPYEAMAAEYIKEQFNSLGLKAFDNNYLQPVPVYSNSKFTGCEFYFDGYKGKYPEDFRSVILFDSLKVEGEVVYAGYGNDSDYGNMDVRDKWVLIVENNNSILYERKTTAKEKGASGLLVIGKDGTSGDDRYVLPADSMPIIKISHPLASQLFSQAGISLSDVLKKLETVENNVIAIPVVVNVTIKSETQWVMSQNVVGYLENAGSGNDKGYIVVGAHYDHVGTKTDDDVVQIFNGADDNASGVAGVLEIAEKLNAGHQLKYDIIFVAFGAEEAGLVGSRVFCDNPPVPIEKIKLMVNLDMIGRMDSTNHIYINTIEATSRFDTVLDEIKKMYPAVNVAFKLDGYLRGSDHTSFFNKNIPVVYFTTGLHNDYHKPTDTADRINLKGQKILLDFVYDFIISSFY